MMLLRGLSGFDISSSSDHRDRQSKRRTILDCT